MRYLIDGASIESGEAQSFVIEAEDQAAAVAQANARGMMVAAVRPEPPASPATEAPAAANRAEVPTQLISRETPEPVPSYRLLYVQAIVLEVIGVLVCMGGLIGLFLAGEESGVFFLVGGLILNVIGELTLAFRDHVINGWHMRQALERRG